MISAEELQQTLSLHVEWLRTAGAAGQRADLSGVDLRMQELDGVDLSKAILRGTNFERANLVDARLGEADLRSANLSYARLRGGDLRKADLSNARAVGADMTGADLSETVLEKSVFDDARCSSVNLRGAKGRVIKFNRCDLSRAMLDEVRFEDAQFRYAKLSNASLCGAELWGGSLVGAEVADVSLDGAKIEEVAVDPTATAFMVPEDRIELTAKQARRAWRLRRKRKSPSEIAHVLGVPRVVIRNHFARIDSEFEAAVATNRVRKVARMWQRCARLSLLVTVLSMFVFVLAGFTEFVLVIFRGNSGEWGYAWYVWLLMAALSGGTAYLLRDHLFILPATDANVEANDAVAAADQENLSSETDANKEANDAVVAANQAKLGSAPDANQEVSAGVVPLEIVSREGER